MINWTELSKEEKAAAIQNAAGVKGIPPQAVEKDLWVTNILQVVFKLPYADKLVFKGGTSLSKVFGKIQRFSEDIDLAIDRSHFGLKGDLTKKQLKKLRKASSTFVRDVMLKDLELTLTKYDVKDIDIVAEPDGEGDSTYPDPRKIHIEYESLFKESLNYIKPRVMLEIGARSLTEPFIMSRITSLVSEVIPDLHTNIVDVDIPTAAIEKTFLEKAFLCNHSADHFADAAV